MSNNGKATSGITASARTTAAGIGEDEISGKYADKIYVRGIGKNGLHYTDAFYVEMYRRSHEQGMTYAQAYSSLGFDIEELGYRRATQAGYRSARFVIERFIYDGDDGIIDITHDSGLTLEDFGISRVAKDELDIELAERETFLGRVLEGVPLLVGGSKQDMTGG